MSDVAMAEEAIEASVSQEQAAAAQNGTPEWLQGLPEHYEVKDPKSEGVIKRPLRADKTLARYKTVDEAAKALIEANRTIGQGLNKIPGAEATAEEKRAFWDKLGVPEDVEGYSDVKVPEVDGLVADDEMLSAAKRLALKNGVLPEQLQDFVNLYAEMTVGAKQKMVNGWIADQEGLQEEWGIQFKANSAKAQRAFTRFFDKETGEIIQAFGLDYYPGFLKGFHRIATQLQEHGLIEGGALASMDTSSAK